MRYFTHHLRHTTNEAPPQTDESKHSALIILRERDWQNDGGRMMCESCAENLTHPQRLLCIKEARELAQPLFQT